MPVLAGRFLPASNPNAANVPTDTTNFDTNLNSTHTNVQLALDALEEVVGAGESQESVQDKAWAAVGGSGTETLITVTYQDATDDVDFVVDSDLHNYSWTNVDGTDLKVGSVTQAYDADLDDLAGGITGLVLGSGDGGGYAAATLTDGYVWLGNVLNVPTATDAAGWDQDSSDDITTSSTWTGGDLDGTGLAATVIEANVNVLQLNNIGNLAVATNLGITTGNNLTTISGSASDNTINEYLAAINTALANVLSGTTSFSGLTASGNLDIGAYELRAQTFESDATTGTAPFTVASTTVVTNLNADTVDGESASAIVTTGRVGTASPALDNSTAQLSTSATVGDVAFTDLDDGTNYTNFSGSSDDDTIDELFAALDSTISGLEQELAT